MGLITPGISMLPHSLQTCGPPAAPDRVTCAAAGPLIGDSNANPSARLALWGELTETNGCPLWNNHDSRSRVVKRAPLCQWAGFEYPALAGGSTEAEIHSATVTSPLPHSQQCVGKLRRHGPLKANYHRDNTEKQLRRITQFSFFFSWEPTQKYFLTRVIFLDPVFPFSFLGMCRLEN